MRQAVISYGIMSLIILLAVAGLAIFITRSVVRQLGGEPLTVIDLMTRASSGDLTVEVPSAPKGSILDSAGSMVRSIRQMLGEISQGLDPADGKHRAYQPGFGARLAHGRATTIRRHLVDGGERSKK